MDGVLSGDLPDRLAATDRFHGDSGLELGAMGAALADRWEPRSGALPRLRGNDRTCPAKPVHLSCLFF
jgi:hypothetical protein